MIQLNEGICGCKRPIPKSFPDVNHYVCATCLRRCDSAAMGRMRMAAEKGLKGTHGSSKHREQRIRAFQAKQKRKAAKRRKAHQPTESKMRVHPTALIEYQKASSCMINTQPLWNWMNERHAIYVRRSLGKPAPWSSDPVFQTNRFCNVFRELDTVTKWIRENIRVPYVDHENLWFMLAIARMFNWPPTLQAMMDEGHWPTKKWDGVKTAAFIDSLIRRGEKVYTGAYMIQAENNPRYKYFGQKSLYVCDVKLGDLWRRRHDFDYYFCGRDRHPTLQEITEWITQVRGWGVFMAYEVVSDLRWTRYCDEAPDIMSWAAGALGSIRGLNRLWGEKPNKMSLTQAQALGRMQLLCRSANDSPSFLHKSLFNWSGQHTLIEMRDIEHSLCELDKYLRIKSGEGKLKNRFISC